MGTSTRIFIDFWNFQINWNDRTNKAMMDWSKVPIILLDQAKNVLLQVGLTDPLTLEETIVHASVKRGPEDRKLKGWLESYLNAQPSFRVEIRERQLRKKGIHCRHCGTDTRDCPGCGQPYERAAEKGVDAAIVTDLLSLAWENAYEIALLLSSDADLIPAVEKVQERGLKVINATWAGYGYDLAKHCWASFQLDSVTSQLIRP